MLYLPIILGSTRRGRQSPKPAKYLLAQLQQRREVETELLDLGAFNFPVMEERLARRDDPPAGLREFSEKIARADALLIVTPEYNNGYPGVLKNALDYLYAEYRRKPVGICTVSAGAFGGIHCLQQLRQVVLTLGAIPLPVPLPVSRVGQLWADDGTTTDAAFPKFATAFLDELLWYAEALQAKRTASP